MKFLAVPLIVLLALAALAAFNTFYTVNPAQQAIVLQLGEAKDVEADPGLKIKTPFIQNVVFIDKRVLALDIPSREVTFADQKRYFVDAFVRYRITNALRFYQSVGTEATLRPQLARILDANLREVLGQQASDVILTGERATLMVRIRDNVNEEAAGYGIEVVDVRIRRADLPEANSKAIYDRMATQRRQVAAEIRAQGNEESIRIRSQADRERTVLLAEARRDSEILRGTGDAERNRIFAEAFSRDPDFFAFYRSMEAYRQSLAGSDTTLVLTPNSEFFRYFGEAKPR